VDALKAWKLPIIHQQPQRMGIIIITITTITTTITTIIRRLRLLTAAANNQKTSSLLPDAKPVVIDGFCI